MAEVATSERLEATFREEWGRCIAAVARSVGDLGLAEDAVQEAIASALRHWPASGIPERPGAWLTTTARRHAIDRLRRESRRSEKEEAALRELERAGAPEQANVYPVADDQLRMIFTCCHPALSAPAQVGLTLRLVCGLSTAQIARAFLEPEPTTAQRVSRAKRRVRDAGIPLRIPDRQHLAERLAAVLACVQLVYREGYAATGSEQLIRASLCEEGRRLSGLLAELLPEEPEVLGLHALLLLQEARRPARTTPAGDLVLLEDQDRRAWDRTLISEGIAVLDRAASHDRPGPYQIQAALAAEHARAPTWEATDWRTIVALYQLLQRLSPSPVVELNQAIAIAQLEGPAVGLELVDAIEDAKLARSHLFAATRAEFLRRLGRKEQAREALRSARDLAPTAAERRFLVAKLDGCGSAGDRAD